MIDAHHRHHTYKNNSNRNCNTRGEFFVLLSITALIISLFCSYPSIHALPIDSNLAKTTEYSKPTEQLSEQKSSQDAQRARAEKSTEIEKAQTSKIESQNDASATTQAQVTQRPPEKATEKQDQDLFQAMTKTDMNLQTTKFMQAAADEIIILRGLRQETDQKEIGQLTEKLLSSLKIQKNELESAIKSGLDSSSESIAHKMVARLTETINEIEKQRARKAPLPQDIFDQLVLSKDTDTKTFLTSADNEIKIKQTISETQDPIERRALEFKLRKVLLSEKSEIEKKLPNLDPSSKSIAQKMVDKLNSDIKILEARLSTPEGAFTRSSFTQQGQSTKIVDALVNNLQGEAIDFVQKELFNKESRAAQETLFQKFVNLIKSIYTKPSTKTIPALSEREKTIIFSKALSTITQEVQKARQALLEAAGAINDPTSLRNMRNDAQAAVDTLTTTRRLMSDKNSIISELYKQQFGELDPYKLLGVSQNSPNAEIKIAYEKLRDASKNDRTALGIASRAYTILSSPGAKNLVDQRLASIEKTFDQSSEMAQKEIDAELEISIAQAQETIDQITKRIENLVE